MAKPSSFGRYSSPCTLRLGHLWLDKIWSKGLMLSANKPLTGKGEIGASAETVQTMWYGMRRPLSTDAPAETYIVPANKKQYWAFPSWAFFFYCAARLVGIYHFAYPCDTWRCITGG
uniref:Uncharacterized protein n=2 Tax=Oryza sativa subsp. japonica TaxID=39947 RepID=Q7G474_ORYSJ|nr:hypothetical protein [Oryza sativa Japonica Group]AAP52707.1 hypothetical protein LOC_Os10g13620 [Oryza sativa Japonica Group]